MRALVQRVSRAQVRVGQEVIARIGPGLVIFLGVARGDTPREAEGLAERVAQFRIFDDGTGRMNRSLLEEGGAALVVSQVTLVAAVDRGRRPGFDPAAPPQEAQVLYEHFVEALRNRGIPVETGRFGARMEVEIHNEGPVTFLLETLSSS